MKKTVLLVTAIMLLACVGAVNAETSVWKEFDNKGGTSFYQEETSVKGNLWDYPEDPVPKAKTATIKYTLMNEGSLKVTSQTTTFGTGQQWPNINNPGEWSGMFQAETKATGMTQGNTNVKVVTLQPPYNSLAYGEDKLVTMTMTDEDVFDVEVETKFVFDKSFSTNEDMKHSLRVFINPFEE